MSSSLAERFRALHVPGTPLLMPNVWDVGSARLLVSLGFTALATTSSGFAATLGRLDYGVTREEAIGHGAQLASAVDVPIGADLENGFGDDPEAVADTMRQAVAVGLAGGSVEDSTGDQDDPIYELAHAAARVAAGVEAARAAGDLVVTARAENFLWGRKDLADTITRLQAYQEAGADVLFAPGLSRAEDIGAVVSSVDRPVSVLGRLGVPSVPELAELGVARISVGGGFAFAALGAVVEAAEELRGPGSYTYGERGVVGHKAAREAFDPGR